MNKRDALKLKPGAWVLFGEKRTMANDIRPGKVLHVTPKGGIRLEINASGNTDWVPYSNVYSKEDVPAAYAADPWKWFKLS